MKNKQINDKIVVDCLQDYCKGIRTSRELKEFLETNFQFDGYYSIDDSYLDYYISALYLGDEVKKQLNSGADVFVNKIKECDGGMFWKKYKDKIEPQREYTTEEEINLVFKDLDSVNYSKFSTMQGIIEYRIEEMKKCYSARAYLSVIILAGSVLEALLVSLYGKKDFSVLIEEAFENNILDKFSYDNSTNLRIYRNYIHPYKQITETDKFAITKINAEFFIKSLSSVITNIIVNKKSI